MRLNQTLSDTQVREALWSLSSTAPYIKAQTLRTSAGDALRTVRHNTECNSGTVAVLATRCGDCNKLRVGRARGTRSTRDSLRHVSDILFETKCAFRA